MKPSEYRKFLEIHLEAARTESKEAAAWDVALEMFGLVEFPGEETQSATEQKKGEKPKAKRVYSYKPKKCERCGKEFTPGSPNQKVCYDCMDRRKTEEGESLRKAGYRKNYAYKPKECKNCGEK